MRFTYPEGKRKALTFSYDDGQVFDKRLVAIFNQYGMKGTFHLNSGKLGIHRGKDNYVELEDVVETYQGHEVACHGVKHLKLTNVSPKEILEEIQDDRVALEKLTGDMVQGMSYAYGNYNEEVKQIARMLGIKYSRTTIATMNFIPPNDFLEWHPTCHNSDNIMELGGKFLDVSDKYELPLMYVWGHSFEFGWPDDWSVIEKFAEKMAYKEDIWYATNMEICRYIEAVRSQELSADTLSIYNPTSLSVWITTEDGCIEVKPGEKRYLGNN